MNELYHYGVLGMHWGIRRYQPYPKGHKGGKFLGNIKRKNQVRSRDKRRKKIADTIPDDYVDSVRKQVTKNGQIDEELFSNIIRTTENMRYIGSDKRIQKSVETVSRYDPTIQPSLPRETTNTFESVSVVNNRMLEIGPDSYIAFDFNGKTTMKDREYSKKENVQKDIQKEIDKLDAGDSYKELLGQILSNESGSGEYSIYSNERFGFRNQNVDVYADPSQYKIIVELSPWSRR